MRLLVCNIMVVSLTALIAKAYGANQTTNDLSTTEETTASSLFTSHSAYTTPGSTADDHPSTQQLPHHTTSTQWYQDNTNELCYKFLSSSMGWVAAKNRCAQEGGHLPIIPKENVQRGFDSSMHAATKLVANALNADIPIGLSCVSNTCNWVDGSILNNTVWVNQMISFNHSTKVKYFYLQHNQSNLSWRTHTHAKTYTLIGCQRVCHAVSSDGFINATRQTTKNGPTVPAEDTQANLNLVMGVLVGFAIFGILCTFVLCLWASCCSKKREVMTAPSTFTAVYRSSPNNTPADEQRKAPETNIKQEQGTSDLERDEADTLKGIPTMRHMEFDPMAKPIRNYKNELTESTTNSGSSSTDTDK